MVSSEVPSGLSCNWWMVELERLEFEAAGIVAETRTPGKAVQNRFKPVVYKWFLALSLKNVQGLPDSDSCRGEITVDVTMDPGKDWRRNNTLCLRETTLIDWFAVITAWNTLHLHLSSPCLIPGL